MSLSARQLRLLNFVRVIANILDEAFTIPGTKIKIGVDAIIGIIPAIGDVVGFMLSSSVILAAVLLPASPWTIARMILNVIIETVIGLIPVVGDGFDIFWKANMRNHRLLQSYANINTRPRDDRRAVLTLFFGTSLVIATLLAITLYAASLLWSFLWQTASNL